MNEAVDRVIEQREALDRGFPAGMVLSATFHLLVVGTAFGAAWLGPRPPLVRVADGIAIALPPGGGGPLDPAPARAAAPAPPAPEPVPPAPVPEPPPKVVKPPKEEPRRGLPRPDARKARPKPEKTVAPARSVAPASDERRTASSGAAGARGTNPATPGLGLIGPAGPGVPYGTDPLGDWYLAGVQRKIWLIWMRQVKTGFSQPIRVGFTILGDGSLEDGSVQVVQASGVQLLDLAAQRAVFSAAPFGPLPRTYGTNRITIQALFQPTP
jgi:outer membrane biosynthesis protein TonB